MRQKGALLIELFFIMALLSMVILSVLMLYSHTIYRQRQHLTEMVAISIADSIAAKLKAGVELEFPLEVAGFKVEKKVVQEGGTEIVYLELEKEGRRWSVPVQ